MENNYGFLKIFLNEPIYHIKEKQNINAQKRQTIVYHGENKQHITVVVTANATDFLKSADDNFLSKVMEAVKLSKHEYALVNLNENSSLSLSQVQEELQPKKLLVFGESTFELFAKKYEIGQKKDLQFMLADALPTIQVDKEKKRLLWEALQRLFL